MRLAGIVGGLILALAGAVWIFQGLDAAFAPESFMTNNRSWIFFGALAVLGGGWLAIWSWRKER